MTCRCSFSVSKKLTRNNLCGDSYRIYDNHPELDLNTLPLTAAGLSIVKRKNENRSTLFTK